jgi:hypothetical protein
VKISKTSEIVRDLRAAIQKQTPKQKLAVRVALRRTYGLPEGK